MQACVGWEAGSPWTSSCKAGWQRHVQRAMLRLWLNSSCVRSFPMRCGRHHR
jgi:hypothetical protein